MLGKHNVAGPTLASLGTNFGLQDLIGKPVALVSDARIGGKADVALIAERLLSISGQDLQNVDRKYSEPWSGYLPTRFVILTNELPRFTDASGALASRFVVFMLTRSFYGKENPTLTDELLQRAAGDLQLGRWMVCKNFARERGSSSRRPARWRSKSSKILPALSAPSSGKCASSGRTTA